MRGTFCLSILGPSSHDETHRLSTRDEWVSLEIGVQTKLPNAHPRVISSKQCFEDHSSQTLGMATYNVQVSEPHRTQRLWGWVYNIS